MGWATLSIVACALALALFYSGKAIWRNGLRDEFVPRNFAVVEPGLFRSGRLNARTAFPTLRDHKIVVVISLISDEDDRAAAQPMIDAMRLLHVDRIRFSMDGNGVTTPAEYADAIDAIVRAESAGRGVLVHCNSGAQRTGGVVAAYELIVRRRPVAAVVDELLAHGHDPARNPGLIPWLDKSMPLIAAELARRGDLCSPPPKIYPSLAAERAGRR